MSAPELLHAYVRVNAPLLVGHRHKARMHSRMRSQGDVGRGQVPEREPVRGVVRVVGVGDIAIGLCDEESGAYVVSGVIARESV